MAPEKLRIVQRKSANGATKSQRATLESLGLRGIGRSTERPDSPALRGGLRAGGHLVSVTGGDETKDGKKQKDG
jgi:large subunit ribosomal protein L30